MDSTASSARRSLVVAAAAACLAAAWPALAAQPALETVSSRERVHVHAELVVTRRLLHSAPVRLLEALPPLADIDGAMVVPHGPPARVELERSGIALEGVQQSFSVFPERSGLLVIPEATARLSSRAQTPDARGQVLRITSPPMAIDVLPMPDSYPENSAWFPAEEVMLRDEWPDASDWAVGEPIDRVLTVIARGAPASAIPPLIARAPDAFRTYPEPGQLDERTAGVVIGKRVERRTLIPTTAGAFVMPSVEVAWWNTRTDTLATTIAPVKRLTVTGAATATAAARQPAPAREAALDDASAHNPAPASEATPKARAQTLILAVLAIAGWSLAIYLAARNRRPRRDAVADTRPSPRAAPSLQALLRRLHRQPPAQAKAATLNWLGQRWGLDRARALRRLQAASAGRDLLDALNDPIYAAQPNQPRELEPLLKAALAQVEPAEGDGAALPPLYPSASATR